MKPSAITKLCLLLALILGLQVFTVACQPTDPTDPAETEPSATDPAETEPQETQPAETEEDIPLTIYENGAFKYCFVYPDTATKALINSIGEYQAILRSKTKKRIEAVALGELTEAHNGLHRIYVGFFPEELCGVTIDVNTLRMGDYFVGREGEDLYITSYSQAPLSTALNDLVESMTDALASDRIVIDDYSTVGYDYSYILAAFPAIELSPENETGTMQPTSNPGGTQFYITNVSGSMATSFFSRLDDGDLEEFDTHRIGNARFGTYTVKNGSYVYYLSYHSNVLRITYVQKRDAFIPDAVDEPSFERVCETKGYLIGVADSGAEHYFQNGQSMVYLLGDGTFWIYDGGYNEDARKLYNILSTIARQNNLSEIVVSGWLITHSHGDHIGFWESFMSDYVKDGRVKVERLFFNPCTPSMGTAGYNAMKGTDARVLNSCRAHSPATKIYNLYTGQKFYMADMLVEVIYTSADYHPSDKALANDDTNAASTVTRLTFGEVTVLMTGDACNRHCQGMVEAFGDGLESTIVQTPHHGVGNGATVPFYTCVAPTYALFTCGDKLYQSHALIDAGSKWLIKNLDAENIYLAGYHNGSTTRVTEIDFENLTFTVTTQ